MKKNILLLLLLLLTAVFAYGQMPQRKLDLPLLQVNDKAIEWSLTHVSVYMSSKPKGMHFPVSKVTFIQTESGFDYEITAIDNTWTNLFNYGESKYGYAIVANRLFVIVGIANQTVQLNKIFSLAGTAKSFTKASIPPAWKGDKTPKWYFKYQNGISEKVRDLDLEILE